MCRVSVSNTLPVDDVLLALAWCLASESWFAPNFLSGTSNSVSLCSCRLELQLVNGYVAARCLRCQWLASGNLIWQWNIPHRIRWVSKIFIAIFPIAGFDYKWVISGYFVRYFVRYHILSWSWMPSSKCISVKSFNVSLPVVPSTKGCKASRSSDFCWLSLSQQHSCSWLFLIASNYSVDLRCVSHFPWWFGCTPRQRRKLGLHATAPWLD